MPYSVNDLIQQAYTRTGLVGDGQSVNGTKAKTALVELNDLIRTLNLQEYIADNIKEADVTTSGVITIGNSPDADIQVEILPTMLKYVSRKQGNRFIPLHTSNLETIKSSNMFGTPTMFTYNVAFDKNFRTCNGLKYNRIVVETEDDLPPCTKEYVETETWWASTKDRKTGFAMGTGSPAGVRYVWTTSVMPPEFDFDSWIDSFYEYEDGAMIGRITVDSRNTYTYKIMYVESIPEYELDDKIMLQPIYKGLLLAGLSYKLAIRYKVQDWVGTFKDEFDQQKSLIKRANSTNRNMTWFEADTYMDNYYNGFAGKGW